MFLDSAIYYKKHSPASSFLQSHHYHVNQKGKDSNPVTHIFHLSLTLYYITQLSNSNSICFAPKRLTVKLTEIGEKSTLLTPSLPLTPFGEAELPTSLKFTFWRLFFTMLLSVAF